MAHSITKWLGGAFAATAVAASLALTPAAAFAAPVSGSVIINGLAPNDTVTLYKVVDIDINGQNVAVPTWASKVSDQGEMTPADLTAWQGYSSDSAGAVAMANRIAQIVSDDTSKFTTNPEGYTTRTGTVAADANTVTISDVESGQYLVVVTGEGDSVSRVYQDTIVSVLPQDSNDDGLYDTATGSANLKATDMKGDGALVKKIDEDGKLVDLTDNSDFDGSVDFRITTIVPQYTKDGQTYVITDKMSDGLTLDQSSFDVTLGGEPLAATTDYVVNPNPDGATFTLTLTDTALGKVGTRAGESLVVKFSATVDDDVTYAKDETNTAHLTYSENSANNDTVTTKDDTVTAKFYGVTFTKVGLSDGELAALPNATFQLKNSDGTTIDELTTSADGVVMFDGLAEGTYTIHESAAPAGYAPIADITVVVADGGSVTLQAADGFTASAPDQGLTTITGAEDGDTTPDSGEVIDPVSDITSMLPTTGGPGTVALTAAGVVLVAGAAAFIVRSRKQN